MQQERKYTCRLKYRILVNIHVFNADFSFLRNFNCLYVAHCEAKFAQLNPLMRNVFSHPYQLDESISRFIVVGGIIFHFMKILKETSVCKQWRTGSDAAFCGV